MLDTLDKTIIVVYFVVVIAVGLWFARRVAGSEEFFLAGRRLLWPFVGLSLFATNISTEHLVGLAEAGHKDGLVWGGYEWIASYCLIMLAAVFAPQYLRHRVFTIPEYFEKRYGPEARIGLTIYFLAMIVLTKTAVALYSGGTVISTLLEGWDLQTVMWAIGIVTAVYTIVGGLAAVVYTDALQSVVLIGGSLLVTVLALSRIGGWSGLEQGLAEVGREDHLSMVRGPDDPTLPFTGYLLGNFLIGGMFYWCMDQVNVQRVLGARDVGQARKGAIFAGFLKIIPVFILVLPGVIAVPLFPEIGDDHKSTYTVLVTELLGSGMRGLVLAALFAALMSSMSSTFNSAATLVSRDLVARVRPTIHPRRQILIGQVAIVVVLVAGVTCADFVARFGSIWDYLQEVTGYLSVPFAVTGLCGVFTRWANRPGALVGVLVGIAGGVFFFVDTHFLRLEWLSHPYLSSFLHRSFLAAVLSLAALWLVSRFTPPPPDSVRAGTFKFRLGPGPDEPRSRTVLGDYRLWMAILFATVTALWIVFR